MVLSKALKGPLKKTKSIVVLRNFFTAEIMIVEVVIATMFITVIFLLKRDLSTCTVLNDFIEYRSFFRF